MYRTIVFLFFFITKVFGSPEPFFQKGLEGPRATWWTPEAQQSGQDVYKEMLEDPVSFSGEKGETVDPAALKEIKIGLFSPVDTKDAVGNDVYRGALLAVEEVNHGGGFRGVSFSLVRRWAVDPWAAGSREMVRMVYVDKVWAVVCFRSASSHIAAQVAAKTRVPVITPVSSDSSITFARVPWVFRLPPDDGAQARLLVEKGVLKQGLKRVGLVTGTDNDCRAMSGAVVKIMNKASVPPVFHFKVPPRLPGVDKYAGRISKAGCDGLVVCLDVPELVSFLKVLNGKRIKCPVLLPWVPGVDIAALKQIYRGPVFMVEPFDMGTCSKVFIREYKKRFREEPTHSAAYAYDAARLIIKAIQSKGLNRAAIREAMADIKEFKGACGAIKWDNGGGNMGKPVLKIIGK